MGSASNNLVIIKGTKEDLSAFRKTAYKNDSEAFCFQQLLPYPSYFEGSKEEIYQQESTYAILFYGNKWGAGYGVLIREEDDLLMYMFNSKTTIAKLEYVSQKYSNLEFIHIGVNTDGDSVMGDSLVWSYIQYQNAKIKRKYNIGDSLFDFNIASELYSYEYIAELYIKIESLIKNNEFIQTCTEEPWAIYHDFPDSATVTFFDLFHRSTYLKDNRELFDDILLDVKSIKQQNLKYAMDEMGYPFRTNSLLYQFAFVKNNYNHDVQNYYLEYIENNLDINELEADDLLIVSKYVFDNFDNYDLFIKLMKIALTKLIQELDDIINSHEKNKTLLKDYPGIIPQYTTDNILVEKYFNLYEWDIFEKDVNEYYAKKKKIDGFRSEYLLKLADKEIKIDRYGNGNPQTNAKEFIKEALAYMELYERSYQKLIGRIHDEDNPLSLGFDFTTDSLVDYYYMRRVARRYEVLKDFPEIMENEPYDLPF